MTGLPKYARIEIERRWLFDLARCPPFDECVGAKITDRYVNESQLRLRKVEYPTGEVTYKLCKKYGRIAPLGQPIVNIYLTSGEFDLLNQLPGRVVVKRRHGYAEGAVDIYCSDDARLAIFEVEFEDFSSAATYTAPEFVLDEVTHDPRYSGANLAGVE